MNKLVKIAIVTLLCLATVVGVSVALVSCKKGESADYITNLSYDGEVVTWTSVRRAKSYKITIDGTKESIINQMDGTVTYRYDSKGEDFDFAIEAVIKEGSDKNPKYQIRFQNIGEVTGLAVSQGTLTWKALEGAEKYAVMYNGDVVTSDVGTASYTMTPGQFSYKVRALKGLESADNNNPYFSVWSEAISGTLLAAPQNFAYDSDAFTWDAVDGASGYVIKVGEEETTVNTNRFAYSAGTVSFFASVYAVGNAATNVYDSAYCEAKEYTYIPTVENLEVVDGVLKWSPSANATGYKVKVNGSVIKEELTTTEYTALASGNSYRVQVLPVSKEANTFSHWSAEFTVNILRSPVVSYSDGVIRWNQVTGCGGYVLKITKGDAVVLSQTLGEETFVYEYAFDEAGDYLVSVKATAPVGAANGIYDSKYSNAYSVKRLAAPTGQQLTNRPLEQNQLSIAFTPALGATSHALYADGVEIATITSGATFNVDLTKMTSRTEESNVSFQIVARGGVTANGAVLDCKTPLAFNATRLATPQNLSINGREITWDAVARTSKYVITIDGRRTEVTAPSFTLTDLAAGQHTVRVQAMGDGQSVITGGFSEAITLKKLNTPANVVLADGVLTWDLVPGATAYKVLVGSESYNADASAFDLLGYLSHISEGVGTQISVYAIGNGADVVDSDVSATKTISRYNRPTTVKVNGDSLVWNPSSVDSINCNKYEIIIAPDGGEAYRVLATGTSYSMSNFEAGTYTIRVVAKGDMIRTLDSPESDAFTFTKLSAITEVTKNGTEYSWESVLGATGYEIKTSKDATWTKLNANTYTPTFNTEGEFQVSIRALGNGVDVIDSEVYSFTQRVQRITQPIKQDAMTNANAFKVEKDGNTITVTIKKQQGATGYKMFVGGVDRSTNFYETETEIVFTHTMTTVGATYVVQVQVLGGQFNDNGVWVMDSNKSTEVSVKYTNN